MPKVSTKSLRRLASKLPDSAGVVSGALTESADYIEELEKTIKKLTLRNFCIICGDNATQVKRGNFYCEDCSVNVEGD
ncbi:hypothetical protein ABD87_00340 [Lysinibacillus sphaericus]|uniref:hypothetical protein n=1 Tax=Lysinibacillus sphaericus TaxID=1421 RepID=UPI0018CD0B89|nr:hypothetical protein [Lysinibacillus sphaericus]MBG9728036.1 hypothetical protein [Lysinibacillus sphaericus]